MRRKIRKVEKDWRQKIGKIGGGKQGKLEAENRENWRRKQGKLEAEIGKIGAKIGKIGGGKQKEK